MDGVLNKPSHEVRDTVVQQRIGTGYAAPRTGRVGSEGSQRLSVASSSSRASLCGLRIA